MKLETLGHTLRVTDDAGNDILLLGDCREESVQMAGRLILGLSADKDKLASANAALRADNESLLAACKAGSSFMQCHVDGGAQRGHRPAASLALIAAIERQLADAIRAALAGKGVGQ